MPSASDSAHSDSNSAEVEAARGRTLEGLRLLLRDGVSADKRAKDKLDDLAKADKVERTANRMFAEQLDNSLRQGLGCSISHFRVAAPLVPLRHGEKRVYENADDMDERLPKRRCYVEADRIGAHGTSLLPIGSSHLLRPPLHV